MRLADAAKRYGWDAPLTLEIKADVNALAKAFGDAAPVGAHTHDLPAYPGSRSRTKFPRGGTHRLRQWLSHIPNWQVVYKGGTFQRASISIFLAYARIIDQGGAIPPMQMRSKMSTKGAASVMAYQAGGDDIFAKYRRGYNIKPQNYIERGLDAFMKLRGGAGLRVGWRPSTSGG